MTAPLSASDIERLRSWAREICAALLPAGTRTQRDGSWLRFLDQGGLLVHEDGSWTHRSSGKGGLSTLRLIAHLRQSGERDTEQYARAWLQSHEGFGTCLGEPITEESSPASAADAADILPRLVEIDGTVLEYLESRKLARPYPNCAKMLRDARAGEHALAMLLAARGRPVGVELTYVDATGQKSTVPPTRRTFKLERSPDAVFEVPSEDADADITIAEGSADLLSLRWGACRGKLLGLPGINALQHLHLPTNVKITVVAHGDAPGSPAAKALQTGLDKHLLAGCDIYVTAIPPVGRKFSIAEAWCRRRKGTAGKRRSGEIVARR
jgi:hypothetical protein